MKKVSYVELYCFSCAIFTRFQSSFASYCRLILQHHFLLFLLLACLLWDQSILQQLVIHTISTNKCLPPWLDHHHRRRWRRREALYLLPKFLLPFQVLTFLFVAQLVIFTYSWKSSFHCVYNNNRKSLPSSASTFYLIKKVHKSSSEVITNKPYKLYLFILNNCEQQNASFIHINAKLFNSFIHSIFIHFFFIFLISFIFRGKLHLSLSLWNYNDIYYDIQDVGMELARRYSLCGWLWLFCDISIWLTDWLTDLNSWKSYSIHFITTYCYDLMNKWGVR